MQRRNRPILVTGSHRSGSTWIGNIIKNSSRVRYIHEPFNIENKRNHAPFKYWFQYISNNSEKQFQQSALDYITSFYGLSPKVLLKAFLKIRSLRSGYHFLVDVMDRIKKRTLLKDPIALMSADWIHQKTHCDVVVSIRHPAAFVASIKVKGWNFNFKHFLEQDELLHTHLGVYKEQIREQAQQDHSLVEQGILLWNIFYSMVRIYQKKYSESWYFVKHEDLSEDPVAEFQKIFNYLNLEFNDVIKDKILSTTSKDVDTEHERNSRENRFTWKQRLTGSEIALIKENTFLVWRHFYTEKDWE